MTLLQHYFRISLKQYALVGYLLVFITAALSSSTIIVPVPATPVIIAAAATWNPILVGLAASLGVALGELTGYFAGRLCKDIFCIEDRASYQKAATWMRKYGTWAVFGLALIPVILFDIVGLVAGSLKFPLWKFLLACWLGKLPRSLLEAYVGAGIIQLIFPSWFT
jgi:uncharacterized membrane protein YdjX (TVP38/TMEM64 family)